MTDPKPDVILPEDKAELADIHSFDLDYTFKLLSVVEKVALVAPKNTSLLGIAQVALDDLNNAAKVILKRRADRQIQEDAKRAAIESARQKKIADDQAAQAEAAAAKLRVKPVTVPVTPAPVTPPLLSEQVVDETYPDRRV